MNISDFEFWLMSGLIAVLILVIGFFLQALIGEIKGMRAEMSALNGKIATIVTNQEWHYTELSRLDSRISRIENNTTRS